MGLTFFQNDILLKLPLVALFLNLPTVVNAFEKKCIF